MRSRLAAALFGSGLLALLCGPASAQPKPDTPKTAKPKPAPPPATSDPAKAKDDPDFAIQGEYVGEMKTPKGEVVKLGIQLAAQGDGKFLAREYVGGLPGEGWDGKVTPAGSLTTTRDGGKVILECKPGKACAEISNGVMTQPGTGTLKKVERKSPTLGATPPEGAVVLFAGPGDETANWTNGKLVSLSDGTFLGVGAGSKKPVAGFKAHIEFRTPWMPTARGQQRGNSGVYIQQRYEVQVLDSFGLDGKNNECGALYTQTPPKVNMCLPPLVWQTYDIDFTPAAFDADGKKTSSARITLVHNGVTVHDNAELPKQTGYGRKETPDPGPLLLQNHNTPVVYRNVWLVEKK